MVAFAMLLQYYYIAQGFFLHGFSKTQGKNFKTQANFLAKLKDFSPKTQGFLHVYIVTMTSSGQILVQNSRILSKNSIFRHFESQSMPHKRTKKPLA